MSVQRQLSARIEPFDSYWQGPKDVEKGYSSFEKYYRHNWLQHLPASREVETLVVSCGPGYLIKLLQDEGYKNVLGIDSDFEKVKYAEQKGLRCRTEEAFPFLEAGEARYDLIIGEQELNHLSKAEMLEFLKLCKKNLRPGGTLLVYGLNGANPITGPEALAQNIDHFHTFTEYSLGQALELAGFEDIRAIPLNLYVFYKNPLNYVGIALTALLTAWWRFCFKLYGKSNRIFTKKVGAVCVKPRS